MGEFPHKREEDASRIAYVYAIFLEVKVFFLVVREEIWKYKFNFSILVFFRSQLIKKA